MREKTSMASLSSIWLLQRVALEESFAEGGDDPQLPHLMMVKDCLTILRMVSNLAVRMLLTPYQTWGRGYA